MASVVEDAASVVRRVFDEAERRDPEHRRTWVALVDGNNHQLDRIRAEARARKVKVSIVVDFVPVIEYIWKAAWSLYSEGSAEAEIRVRDKALAVLNGGAGGVAGSLRREATRHGLESARREGAESCAAYLTRKSAFL
ncbi:MAG: ISKra4 family transposase, partial [Candidatus Dormibacterales bacterium]